MPKPTVVRRSFRVKSPRDYAQDLFSLRPSVIPTYISTDLHLGLFSSKYVECSKKVLKGNFFVYKMNKKVPLPYKKGRYLVFTHGWPAAGLGRLKTSLAPPGHRRSTGPPTVNMRSTGRGNGSAGSTSRDTPGQLAEEGVLGKSTGSICNSPHLMVLASSRHL